MAGLSGGFDGKYTSLKNIPELPEGVSNNDYRSSENRTYSRQGEQDFEIGLNQIGYPNGFYDVFADETKIASKTDVVVNAGTGGNVELGIAGSYDVSTASFTQSKDISTEDTSPSGIAWNSDGTKMYMIGGGNDSVYEYSVSTAFDVSTASFTQSKDISTEDTSPRGMAWNSDGTKMYIVGNGNDSVYEYSVSTAFDVSTASFTQSKDISSEDPIPLGIAWNSDGTKMYMIGGGNDSVYEYSVSTAFDVSTASFTQSKDISTEDTSPLGIAWNSDGTKMYMTGNDNDNVYEYDVGEGFTTSGTLTSTTQDKGYSASKATLTADYALNGQSIDSIDLFDGADNLLASWTESEIGETKAVSTSRTDYYLKADLSGDGTDTPQVNKYEMGLDN